MANLKELRDERLRKLDEIKKLGVNPYPASSERTNKIGEIIKDFTVFENKSVTVAGRIVGIRKFGKLAFIVLKDDSGEIQLFLQKDTVESTVPEEQQLGMEHLNLLDIGDFIEAHGSVMKSKTDEISVGVEKLRILTKSLRPMPDKQQGFTDKEQRLRRRYVDLNVNDDVRQRFIRRSAFWQATRQFLLNEGFIEINIPVLEHTTGGADANPFVTHMDAIDQDFYLRISHELPLKRLIGGGYEKVFDIGPRFRNENFSDEHLPEHVAMESYAAYQDYEDGMEMYERMIKYVTKKTWGKLSFTDVNGFKVDLDQPWPRIKYADIMKERFDVDVFNPDFEQLKTILKENKVELDGDVNINRALDNVWKIIRRESAGPYWMIHEPVKISPLSKIEPSDPRVTQRFHPIIGGSELGNGFSELNDPQDQLARFLEQQALRESGDSEAMMLDIDFVEMLEYGMPPACGWGNSERNFWFFEGVTAREGVIFPNLRSEVDETTKKIYPDISFEENNRSKQDFTKRMVLVVNQDIQNWQVANAASHMSAYLGRSINHFDTGEYFETKDNQKYPRNTQYPIVIKVASSEELRALYSAAEDAKLSHHGFIQEMIETTNDTKIEKILAEKTTDDVVLYGVGIFGSDEKIKNLTDELELWSGSGDEKPPLSSLPESAVVHGTKKLYLDNWAKLDFAASVVAVSKNDSDQTVVVLDQTAFYPGGGGQPNDIGEINWNGGSIKLSSVSKDEAGVVYHVGEVQGALLVVGQSVNCTVLREPRELHNRLHCAGHLIDYGVQQAGLDWKSGISAHFPGRCYVNYSGEVNADDYEPLKQKIETSINAYIQRGGAVTAIVVPSKKAHEVSEYIPQAVLDSYQNVHIAQYPDNFNICCGGTHVSDVSDIGKVIITKIKKKNGQIRVSYEVN